MVPLAGIFVFTLSTALLGAAYHETAEVSASGGSLLMTSSSVKNYEERIVSLESQVSTLKKTVDLLMEELRESRRPNALIDASREPTTMRDGLDKPAKLKLADRVRYLERKLDGSVNWLTDPQLWRRTQYKCANMSDMGTKGEHHVCFDNWQKVKERAGDKPCIVYDLGIRANPEFGANLVMNHGCSVRAYDPSDIAKKWWAGKEDGTMKSSTLKAQGPGRYNFSDFAAGGVDGGLTLFEFNWDQVSIVHGERDHTKNQSLVRPQKEFQVKAKTLPTMMKEHGDREIDILKVDIEGSEYAFMQQAFDMMGCPPVGQVTLEFHNFALDERYGSSPEINTIHNLLNSCGFKSFMVRDHWRNFVTDKLDYYIPPKRFTLASYCRDCHAE